MITNKSMNTNMNCTMKMGAERAQGSEASEAPPFHRQDYQHEHEYPLQNETGAERAEGSEASEAPPLTQT